MVNTGNKLNFLLVRTDFLGDAVLTNTFIKMLSSSNSVTIDLLCTSYNSVGFKYNPHIRNIHINYYNFSLSDCYDAIFILNRSLSNYKLINNIKTKKIIAHKFGIKSLRSKIYYLISNLFSKYHYIAYNDNIHEVKNQFNLLNYASTQFNFLNNLLLDHESYFYTQFYNPEVESIKDNNAVVINISGRKNSFKYIPFSLVRNIIEDILVLNKSILVIGTKDDQDNLKKLQNYFGNNISILFDDDIFKLTSQFFNFKYFISADGGLIHIAAGLKMYCIALFHQQNINTWHPWTRNQICIQNQQRTIYDLTSEEVITAILKVDNII